MGSTGTDPSNNRVLIRAIKSNNVSALGQAFISLQLAGEFFALLIFPCTVALVSLLIPNLLFIQQCHVVLQCG